MRILFINEWRLINDYNELRIRYNKLLIAFEELQKSIEKEKETKKP
jgi:hypothetical protein